MPKKAKKLSFPLNPGATAEQVLNAICDSLPIGELVDPVAKLDIQVLQGVGAFIEHSDNINSGLRRFREMFYVYTGTHWLVVHSEMLAKFVSLSMSKLGFDDQVCKTARTVKKVKEQLDVTALTWDPDTKPNASVNCANGTVIINEKGDVTIKSHNPKDYYTYCLEYDYDPKSRAPNFMAFLEQSLPGVAERAVALEAIGAAFVGSIKLEKMVVMLGEGANGKSVFTDIVTAVLGSENVGNYSLDDLDGDDTKMNQLDSKLLNYASEIGDGMKTDMLKRLASREPITVRPIYKQPRVLRDYCRFVFNANKLPTGQSGHAYERRFIIVPWERTVPKDERNPNLANEIIAVELPGILNLIIQGARRLITNERYTNSEKSAEALEAYRLESDSVAEWLNESELVSSTQRESTSNVYERYSAFCKAAGRRAVSKIQFGRRMKSLGIESDRSSGQRFYLIGVPDATTSTTEIPAF